MSTSARPTPVDTSLLTVRFSGPILTTNGVPIYELGQTLVSLQKIIYKSYSYFEGRDTVASLTDRERQQLSLQIVGRRRGSDIYELIPFFNGQGRDLGVIVVHALSALAYYTLKVLVIDKPQKDMFDAEEDIIIYDPRDIEKSRKLRRILTVYFNESELRDLCFELNVDYESMRGDGKSDKARELILYMARRGELDRLVAHCVQLRPNIVSPDLLFQGVSPANFNNDLAAKHQALASRIYPEAAEITRRIDNVGGIESIGFITPAATELAPVIVDKQTKEYVKSIRKAEVLGDYLSVVGIASGRFDTTNRSIEFIDEKGARFKAFLSQENFNKVRYNTTENMLITIKGQPVYSLDENNENFTALRGDEVIIPTDSRID